MIDLHILKHPVHNRTVHLNRVLRKLGKVANIVKVHMVDGIEGNIGLARMNGFNCGTNPYVTFMDDDDDIEPSVFQHCIDLLNNDSTIDAVVTDERHVIDGKIKKPLRKLLPNDGDQYNIQTARYIHHLVVMRRTSLTPYINMLQTWPDLCEFTLYGKMILDGNKFIHLDKIGYYWYVHDNNARSLKIVPSQETIQMLKQMYTITNNS